MCARIGYYVIEKTLGSGSFGEVFLAHKADEPNQCFAIKRIEKEKMKMAEVGAGEVLDHENIAKFYEHFQDQQYHYLVFEYVPGVDLFTWMEWRNFAKIPMELARKIFFDICSAMEYCHRRGIVHRDLKLENVLMDPTTHKVKLIDFGLCSFEKGDCAGCVDVCGSLDYIAPEVLGDLPYSGKKSDIWSLGVILYSLVFCTFPFSAEERMDALLPPEGQEKLPHPPLEFPSKAGSELKDLIAKMLTEDPNSRISMTDVMRHPWLQTPSQDGEARQRSNYTSHSSRSRQNQPRVNSSFNNSCGISSTKSTKSMLTTNNSSHGDDNSASDKIHEIVDQIVRKFGAMELSENYSGRDCGSQARRVCFAPCSCCQRVKV
jgi:serine/threonine protein kinase